MCPSRWGPVKGGVINWCMFMVPLLHCDPHHLHRGVLWAPIPLPLLLGRLSLSPRLLLLHLLPLNDHHPRHHLHQVLASRLRPKQGHHCHCFAFVAAVLYATEAFRIISSLEAWSGSSQPSQACSGGQRTMLTGSSSRSSEAPTSISISQPIVRDCVLHMLLPGRSCELHSEAV